MSIHHTFYAGFSGQQINEWYESVTKELKGAAIEKLQYHSADGLDYLPYYTVEQLPAQVAAYQPADFPYRRGLSAAGNDWAALAQIVVHNPKEANRMALHALNHGADAIWFDGAISSDADFEILTRDIQPQYIQLLFNSTNVHELSTWLPQWAESLNISNFVIRAAVVWPADQLPSEDNELLQLVTAYREKLPAVAPFLLSSCHLRSAGAMLVEETALALAAGHDLLHRLLQAGLTVDEAAPLMQFQLALDTDYFAEICRLRAFRQAWARIVDAYNPVHSCTAATTLHAKAGEQALYSLDRHTNLLRLTSMGMSAVVGGVASLSLPAFDLPVNGGNDFSMEISLQIQLMLRHEARLNEVADPAGGAYFLESLTEQIGEKSWKLFQQIEKAGGFTDWKAGAALAELLEAGRRKQRQSLGSRKQIRVGVNQYPNSSEGLTDFDASSVHNPFDELRLQTARAAEKPRIYLASTGDLAMRMARLNFSINFLGCAGYELISSNAFEQAEEAAQAALAAGAHALVLCSDDGSWPEAVAQLGALLKGKILLLLAGAPADAEADFRAAGFEHFIHMRANLLETLQLLHAKLLPA